MNEPGSAPNLSWSIDRCRDCRGYIARLGSDDGAELSVRVTKEDARWIVRARHPSYASHLAPMLEALAKRSLRLEMRFEGPGVLSTWIIVQTSKGALRGWISAGLALLLSTSTGLQMWVDDELLQPPPGDHYEDITDAFETFVATVMPEDFSRFDAGRL